MSTQIATVIPVSGQPFWPKARLESNNKIIFLVGADSCGNRPGFAAHSASRWVNFRVQPPAPVSSREQAPAKFLLHASVVALGFGMNLHQVLRARTLRLCVYSGQHHGCPTPGSRLQSSEAEDGKAADRWSALVLLIRLLQQSTTFRAACRGSPQAIVAC